MALIQKIRNNIIIRVNHWNIINKQAQIGDHTQVRGAKISGKVTIGHHCKIYKTEIFGEVYIGNYSSLWGPNIDLHASLNPITIGNFCSIAKNVTIQEYNHDHSRFSTYFIEKNLLQSTKHSDEIVSKGQIIIEHDIWIGAGSIILSGARISTGAVIAAGSVVSGFVPPYAIVGGIPAKVIKYRFNEDVRNKLLATEWWNWPTAKIKENVQILNAIIEQKK